MIILYAYNFQKVTRAKVIVFDTVYNTVKGSNKTFHDLLLQSEQYKQYDLTKPSSDLDFAMWLYNDIIQKTCNLPVDRTFLDFSRTCDTTGSSLVSSPLLTLLRSKTPILAFDLRKNSSISLFKLLYRQNI